MLLKPFVRLVSSFAIKLSVLNHGNVCRTCPSLHPHPIYVFWISFYQDCPYSNTFSFACACLHAVVHVFTSCSFQVLGQARRVVARATWDKNCVEFYLCLVNESLEWTVACQLIETLFITCRHLRFTIKIKVLGWKILKFHSLCFKQGQMLRVFQQWSRLIFFRSSHYPTLDLHLTKSKVPRECQMNLKTDNKWVRWCWPLIIGFENSVCIILILRFLHRMVHTEKCREQKIRCIERNG